MQRRTGIYCAFMALALVAGGCGKKGPEIAAAGGIVTYQGKPLSGATVVFSPDNGPAAYGTTDAEGRFTWMTNAEPGAMVGPGKVAITAFEAYEAKNEEDITDADLEKMNKSLIPEKYGRVETSGLTATVAGDGKNEFTFELTD